MTTLAFKTLDPIAWLAQQPLRENEHLYLIISAASDTDALGTYRLSGPSHPLLPIWSETPYSTWHAVMPYVTKLAPDSTFLPWITETDALDWGWLAVSRCEPEEVLGHLRSLTQVKMPKGREVFFRFWDGRFIYPILEGLGDDAQALLPVFERYLINGKPLEASPRKVPMVQDWPWWEVPQGLLDALAEQDQSAPIDNLMQWLEEEHPDIHCAWPRSVLKRKVGYFSKLIGAEANPQQTLLDVLRLEQKTVLE
ncbi:DUF4123 domain-containing protein [Pseudomonas sp. D2-30]|uniref:DUF4123 domain-containing protein n=1 Tax=unclassified Pseudomonas TaxID=196821 RepID=UPI003DA97E55